MFNDETIIDTDGNPIEASQSMQSFQQGVVQGGIANLVGTIGGMLQNPSTLQHMTSMDSKRKADLETLGGAAIAYGLGKLPIEMPPAIRFGTAGILLEVIEGALRKR